MEIGGVTVDVLHPPAPEWERQKVRNDDSIVLRLRYGDVELLLTGDAGAEFERRCDGRGGCGAGPHPQGRTSWQPDVQLRRVSFSATGRTSRSSASVAATSSGIRRRTWSRGSDVSERRSFEPTVTARSASRPTARSVVRCRRSRGSSWTLRVANGILTALPRRFHFFRRARRGSCVHRVSNERLERIESGAVNLSLASRSADSGSMPSLRARLAIEKSRSPNSSAARAGLSDSAARSSRTSSSILSTTSVAVGPVESDRGHARADLVRAQERRQRRAARRPAAASSDPRSPCSLALIASHCSTTARDVRACRRCRARGRSGRPAGVNTCGCRRISLAVDRVDRVGDLEPSRLERDLRLKHALKQHVAQLAAQSVEIAAIDRLERLVGLLEQKRPQRLGRLLAVPRTARGRSQRGHGSDQSRERPRRAPGLPIADRHYPLPMSVTDVHYPFPMSIARLPMSLPLPIAD